MQEIRLLALPGAPMTRPGAPVYSPRLEGWRVALPRPPGRHAGAAAEVPSATLRAVEVRIMGFNNVKSFA